MAKKAEEKNPLEVEIAERLAADPQAFAVSPRIPGPSQTGPAIYPAVYRQMVEAARDFAQVGLAKTGVNTQQQFKFRGIDSLMDLASSILWRHNLLVLPNVVSRVVTERETRNGGLLYNVTLDVEFTFVSATDASAHTVRFVGEAMDSADKATNKAQSAAYKYCLLQCFCIPVEGAQEESDQTTPEETVKVTVPEGYAAVKDTAFAQAHAAGTKGLRDYARVLADGGKDSPGFKAWGHLVKNDGDYAKLRGIAEAFDTEAKRIAAQVKTEGVRVPGEEG